jgi:hypothetical protein
VSTYKYQQHRGQIEEDATVVDFLEFGPVITRLMLEREEKQNHDRRGDREHGNDPENPSPSTAFNDSTTDERPNPVGESNYSSQDACPPK